MNTVTSGTTTVKMVYPEIGQPRNSDRVLYEFVQGGERLGSALLSSQEEAEEYAKQRFPYAYKHGIIVRAITATPATETVESVNWRNQPNDYQRRAANTKARRQAAGRYNRPTKQQAEAFRKTMLRDGRKNLTVEEMGLLALHPYLTVGQRAEYAQMAQAAVESAVA